MRALLLFALVLSGAVFGCGDDKPSSKLEDVDSGALAADGGVDENETVEPNPDDENAPKYKLHVRGELTAEQDGAHFFAQNGARVAVPAADIIGKRFLWLTAPGGESIANSDPIEFGGGTINEDLTFEINTEANYKTGPYEVAVVIIVSGGPMPPQDGDLASFSFDGIKEGDPPATGVSVRFNIEDADANLTLTNNQFIRF